MTNFYVLSHSTRSIDLFYEVIEPYNDVDLFKCSISLASPLPVKKSQGYYENDVIRLQDPFNFLISNRLKTLLLSSCISGWRTYDVVIGGKLSENYSGFCIKGRCGSRLRPKEKGFINGIQFEIDTWDRSDIFIPNDSLTIFCTKKVKQVFAELKLKNIVFQRIEDFEWYNPRVR
ncbi:MAG: hypothetical protein ABJ387_00495 [Balneola sp.]|uniref:hypothetical protein n=1 Tax=Balneola sp. EhC07 TaxID=1849360 RepID=UPI0007F3FB2E|nr:hypothetical protein [Balneola sp. EhC07]OAN61356.1 hypothetical protein A8B79_07810 [Balneola sp. EhC07]